MNSIVSITQGQATTTSLAIAEGTGNEHEGVIKLVRRYTADMEEFGPLGFEIRVTSKHGAGQKTEIALLNERQATLLITYMRNSDIVRAFKMRLVKEFYELARNAIPTTFAEALRLSADQAEQIEQQQAKILEFAPKAGTAC